MNLIGRIPKILSSRFQTISPVQDQTENKKITPSDIMAKIVARRPSFGKLPWYFQAKNQNSILLELSPISKVTLYVWNEEKSMEKQKISQSDVWGKLRKS
jgi:hypothetical protein